MKSRDRNSQHKRIVNICLILKDKRTCMEVNEDGWKYYFDFRSTVPGFY